MPAGAARGLADELGDWVRDGLVTGDQARRILARYPAGAAVVAGGQRPDLPPREAGAWVGPLLHTAAGLLVGAAVLAFVYVWLVPEDPEAWAMSLGLAAGVGGVLVILLTERPLLGDALLVTMMTASVVAGLQAEASWQAYVAMVLAAGALVWRHGNEFLQSVAVVGVSANAAMLYFEIFEDSQAEAWLAVQVALLVLVVLADRFLRRGAGLGPALLAVGAFGIVFVVFLTEFGPELESETIEMLLGAAMAGLALGGVGLHHRGVVSGAVVVLAVDAIVFAFDVVKVLGGIVVLLVLAGLFLWQAGRIRAYLAR